MEKIIIVGGFVEIIELCEENNLKIEGIFDNCSQSKLYSYNVLCNDDDAIKLSDTFKKYPLIITPDMPATRKKISLLYHKAGYHFFSLISFESKISKSAKIGNGSVIQNKTNISSEVLIGDFVKVNCCSNIMHNTLIGAYSTIAPNAVLLGHVSIGEECYIGANSTIMPYVKICDKVTIGAGAVVTKNITESGSVYAGVPAKRIK